MFENFTTQPAGGGATPLLPRTEACPHNGRSSSRLVSHRQRVERVRNDPLRRGGGEGRDVGGVGFPLQPPPTAVARQAPGSYPAPPSPTTVAAAPHLGAPRVAPPRLSPPRWRPPP